MPSVQKRRPNCGKCSKCAFPDRHKSYMRHRARNLAYYAKYYAEHDKRRAYYRQYASFMKAQKIAKRQRERIAQGVFNEVR